MTEFALVELARRLENIIRIGTVDAVDLYRARLRVRIGETQTAWLPWLTQRAGDDIDWWAPSEGEQVLVLSPSGDLVQAVALPALYQTAHPAPANDADTREIQFKGGGVFRYNRAENQLSILLGGGRVHIVAKEGIKIEGDVTVDGDVIADDISLKTHVHTGVEPGGGLSSVPQS